MLLIVFLDDITGNIPNQAEEYFLLELCCMICFSSLYIFSEFAQPLKKTTVMCDHVFFMLQISCVRVDSDYSIQ